MHYHIVEKFNGFTANAQGNFQNRDLAEIALEQLRAEPPYGGLRQTFDIVECAAPEEEQHRCFARIIFAPVKRTATIIEDLTCVPAYYSEMGVPMTSVLCLVQEDTGTKYWIDAWVPTAQIPDGVAIGDKVSLEGHMDMQEIQVYELERV